MAFDISTLGTYVDEQRLPLIKKSVLGAKTISLINLQTGVKHSSALNLLDVDPIIQDGGCGWTAQGNAKISQRILTADNYKVNMSLCYKDLLKTALAFEVKAGLNQNATSFDEYITSAVVDGVNAKIEHNIWQGDKDNSGEFDGFLNILNGEALTANGTGAYNAIKSAYEKIPVSILDKAVIFVGADTFRTALLELVEKNLYHYNANGAEAQEFIMPGTNTKVIVTNGLNGSNKVVACDPMNMYFGTDMLDDTETFEFMYDKSTREHRVIVEFNAGVQVAFPNEVVVGTVA